MLYNKLDCQNQTIRKTRKEKEIDPFCTCKEENQLFLPIKIVKNSIRSNSDIKNQI